MQGLICIEEGLLLVTGLCGFASGTCQTLYVPLFKKCYIKYFCNSPFLNSLIVLNNLFFAYYYILILLHFTECHVININAINMLWKFTQSICVHGYSLFSESIDSWLAYTLSPVDGLPQKHLILFQMGDLLSLCPSW